MPWLLKANWLARFSNRIVQFETVTVSTEFGITKKKKMQTYPQFSLAQRFRNVQNVWIIDESNALFAVWRCFSRQRILDAFNNCRLPATILTNNQCQRRCKYDFLQHKHFFFFKIFSSIGMYFCVNETTDFL